MDCTSDYYIIYVILLNVTAKGKGQYMLLKKKKIDNKYNIDDNKNIDKFGFIAP